MALQTETQIFISGTPLLSYKSLELVQNIDASHQLEIICSTNVIERLSEELIGESKDYIGGIITIQIRAASGFGTYRELAFKGVVTSIKATKGYERSSGDLTTIVAQSPCALSNGANHYASYTGVGLLDILQQTFQGYDTGKLETNFAPTSSDTIHYAVQYNQTDFEFTSRLASYYNQWFYYNGTQLVFGSPSNEETELSYGVDLKEFTIELLATATNSTYFTKDYLNQEQYEKNTAEIAIPSEGYHGFMNTKSQELYTKNTKILHNPYHHTDLKPRLDTQVEHYTKAKAMQQVVVKGSSDNPGVNLGEVINVRGYGRYRITSVTHTNTETGVYMNHFEAVTADFDAYPKMDLHNFPKSEIQIATVVENADTDNLGRIKVQFAWQRPLGETTPWLRMITPYAGADKGFHFIPEIGEEVAIGFESGNIEKPFVMGSLYTGVAKPDSWQTNTNDIKAIRTRSGHTLELDDTNGAEMINIYDLDGSKISFNTQEKSLSISATENIEITAKNISIAAEENINIQAQQNIQLAAQQDFSALAEGNLALQSTGDTTARSSSNLAIEATSNLTASAQNTTIEGQATTQINGTQTTVAGQSLTEITAAIVKIN